jgi:hypothetical protein
MHFKRFNFFISGSFSVWFIGKLFVGKRVAEPIYMVSGSSMDIEHFSVFSKRRQSERLSYIYKDNAVDI